MIFQTCIVLPNNSVEFHLIDNDKKVIQHKILKDLSKSGHLHPVQLEIEIDRFLFEHDLKIQYLILTSEQNQIILSAYKVIHFNDRAYGKDGKQVDVKV